MSGMASPSSLRHCAQAARWRPARPLASVTTDAMRAVDAPACFHFGGSSPLCSIAVSGPHPGVLVTPLASTSGLCLFLEPVVCAWRKFTIHLKKQQNANGIRTVRTQLSWARGHTAYPYRDTVCAFATERWMPAASAAAVVTSQGLCCSRLYMVHGHQR